MSDFNEHVWRRKKDIISRVKSIAFNGDLRKGPDEIRMHKDDFRRAGRAGTDVEGVDQDEVLRQEFKQAEDEFYERRNKAREKAIAAKKSLVYEMGKLAARPYDRSVGERARELMTLWKQAERVPKAEEDWLWSEFNKYRDQIKDAARRRSEEHQSRQVDFLEGKISNKESYLSNLESKLYELKTNWQYRERRNPPSVRHPRYSEIVDRERERERRYYERVEALQDKIDQVRSEISALTDQLNEVKAARRR